MGLLDTQSGIMELKKMYDQLQIEAQANGQQMPPFTEWVKQYLEQQKGLINQPVDKGLLQTK